MCYAIFIFVYHICIGIAKQSSNTNSGRKLKIHSLNFQKIINDEKIKRIPWWNFSRVRNLDNMSLLSDRRVNKSVDSIDLVPWYEFHDMSSCAMIWSSCHDNARKTNTMKRRSEYECPGAFSGIYALSLSLPIYLLVSWACRTLCNFKWYI